MLLLAGSDSGASNSYVYPGAALLGELDQLVRAGLTPAQALRTATINGAIFFHQPPRPAPSPPAKPPICCCSTRTR